MNEGKLIDADKLLSKLSKDIIWHSQWLILKKAINELSEESNALKEEEKEETYTCRCGKELTIPNCGCQSDDDLIVFNIISDEVKADYLCHRVNKLETDNAALRKEIVELKLKLKDLIK